MINGWVTYEELKLVTGFNDRLLKELLINGMTQHQLNMHTVRRKEITEQLFNLDEVQKWISIHIF